MATTAEELAPKDRVYKLVQKEKPLSYVLASRNTKRMRLLHYDSKKNVNRELRYAVNSPSPFVDEQSGEVILEEIIFDKGILFVPATNPALQAFLKVHPGLGRIFEELDPEAEAEKEMVKLDQEAQAIIAANQLTLEQCENLFRVLFGKDPGAYKSAVIQRDVKVHARNSPADFLSKLDNPALSMQSDIRLLFDRKILGFRNGNRDIHYNLKDNKKQLMSVPAGRDPYRELQAFFETEEGIEVLKILTNAAENF